MSQATLTDYGRDRRHGPFRFDTYGPTSDRPLPPEEAGRQAWKERLRARGFCPNCLLEWLSHAGMDTYHIDDRDDPERIDIWKEQLARSDAP